MCAKQKFDNHDKASGRGDRKRVLPRKGASGWWGQMDVLGMESWMSVFKLWTHVPAIDVNLVVLHVQSTVNSHILITPWIRLISKRAMSWRFEFEVGNDIGTVLYTLGLHLRRENLAIPFSRTPFLPRWRVKARLMLSNMGRVKFVTRLRSGYRATAAQYA